MLAIPRINVPGFTEPSNWPSNSPDLNLVDYSIWAALQQLMPRQKFKNVIYYSEVSPEQLLGHG